MDPTPLQRQLSKPSRSTALDAFTLARAEFLAGHRIDLRSLAAQLGVSRVTLYRWVGTREQLLVEVIWSLTEQTLRQEWARLSDRPGPRVPGLMAGLMRVIWDQPGARRFLEQEKDLAMRLLTLATHGFQPRMLDLVRARLADDLGEGRVTSPIPLDDLAYTVLRVTESFHYLPVITGEPADPGRAARVLAALLPPPP